MRVEVVVEACAVALAMVTVVKAARRAGMAVAAAARAAWAAGMQQGEVVTGAEAAMAVAAEGGVMEAG